MLDPIIAQDNEHKLLMSIYAWIDCLSVFPYQKSKIVKRKRGKKP